ncbi:unnamed protein product [Hymenolepis diminuta]|uniref:Uncharacterized protein n=1 Tax=Hymenolepis diminuta TaxID=6216 RepID=A0A564XU55_HYMDI|nr:unnamed protein product [Hymenolepis diminuta]
MSSMSPLDEMVSVKVSMCKYTYTQLDRQQAKLCNMACCDANENSVANLPPPQAIQITILLCKFNRSDHDLYSCYLQPMDPDDLTYEKTNSKLGSAVNDNNSLYNLAIREAECVYYCTEDQFGCLASILGLRSPCHAKIRLLLDEEPDVKKPLRGSELVAGPITQVFNLRGPENDFGVNVTIIKTALPMPLPEVQRKWSLL